MADLLSQVIELNLDDVNDIAVEHFGDRKYSIRIGENTIVCKCYEDLKTICLNIQSAFEKLLKLKLDDCRTLDDVNDIAVEHFGDGKYSLRIGELSIVCKCYQDLKTACLNIQSAFEKMLKYKLDDCRTTEETISAVNDNFKSILKVYGGAK